MLFIEANTTNITNSDAAKESFRMEGICQSYNIFDSIVYRDLNFMRDILEDVKEDEFDKGPSKNS